MSHSDSLAAEHRNSTVRLNLNFYILERALMQIKRILKFLGSEARISWWMMLMQHKLVDARAIGVYEPVMSLLSWWFLKQLLSSTEDEIKQTKLEKHSCILLPFITNNCQLNLNLFTFWVIKKNVLSGSIWLLINSGGKFGYLWNLNAQTIWKEKHILILYILRVTLFYKNVLRLKRKKKNLWTEMPIKYVTAFHAKLITKEKKNDTAYELTLRKETRLSNIILQ